MQVRFFKQASSRFAVLVGAVVLFAACAPPGVCEDFDAMEHTEHFVISDARAAALMAAAARDAGLPTCVDDCFAMSHFARSVGACSVGARTDGGVSLACTFKNFCR